MRMVMISRFRRTRMRLNGALSDNDSLGTMSAKRGSSCRPAMKLSICARVPARNRLMPSGASRIVPFNANAWQRASSFSRSVGRSSRLMNL